MMHLIVLYHHAKNRITNDWLLRECSKPQYLTLNSLNPQIKVFSKFQLYQFVNLINP